MTDWAKIREKLAELQKDGDIPQGPVNWAEAGKKLAELQNSGDIPSGMAGWIRVAEEIAALQKTGEKTKDENAAGRQKAGSMDAGPDTEAEKPQKAGDKPSGVPEGGMNRTPAPMDGAKIREGVRLLLEGIGEDPDREGLLETPERIARMYRELFCGMSRDAAAPLAKTFQTEHTDLVLEKDITFYSVCEHHLLPFYGKAHVAYIPGERVVGLSKLARTVEIFARRLQLQERMTAQIADAVMEHLQPAGVMVMLEAEHMCMTMRGIRKPGSQTVTFASRGVFESDRMLQEQFFRMVRH